MIDRIKTLSKMFRKEPRDQPATTECSGPEIISPDKAIPENLFIEKEGPAVNESDAIHPKETKLASFLNRDFGKLGYNDGYRYHTSDVLDNYKRLIRSEFREIIDFMIDDLRCTQARLQKHLVDVRSLSNKAEDKVSNRINEVEEAIVRLLQEKDLSSADEGIVTKSIHLYRDGFIRGMEDYNEEILLMSYSPLFKL